MTNPFQFPGEEFESMDDIALSEGFLIDDDGHWIPIEGIKQETFEEEPDYGWVSEEELARDEGFYIDDDGDWVPMDF